ncbi:MAG: hypothetical protein EZS28_024491 [Streblomastix strix]|uniref:Uncharacterized protein n=1 Tax=Streblomastix strix TaxID=222440 RepID=A0A5J4VC94_9EUKA|nr:MAG: hypothetical protein EZS28_024491 [Streblomastix strix]
MSRLFDLVTDEEDIEEVVRDCETNGKNTQTINNDNHFFQEREINIHFEFIDELDLIEMEKEENMIEDNENQQDQQQINSNDDKTKQTNYFNNNNTNNNSNNQTQSKQIIDDRLTHRQNNRLFELQKLYQSLSEVGEQIAAYDHFAEKVDSELLKWSKMIEYASQQRMDLQKRVEQRIEYQDGYSDDDDTKIVLANLGSIARTGPSQYSVKFYKI